MIRAGVRGADAINATLFDVLLVLITRVYSPGVATAVVLLYPVVGWSLYVAWTDGALTPASGLAARGESPIRG